MSKLTDFFPSASGIQNALLVMIGGGGGAGNGSGYAAGAAGGDILCTFLSIKTGVTCPIIVGAGGAAGCTNPACCGQPGGVGGDGGYSSFGELRAPGGGGAGTQCCTLTCVAPTPYTTGYCCVNWPAVAPGGVGGSYLGGHYTRMLRGLPLKYSGFVGSTARRATGVCFWDNQTVVCCCPGCVTWPDVMSTEHSTILMKNRVVTCSSTVVSVATCKPGCPGTFCRWCRVVCSNFYNVELSGQPYSQQDAVDGGCSIIPRPFPLSPCDAWPFYGYGDPNIVLNGSLACTRFSGNPSGRCSIENYPNTGNSGRFGGCNGDSGVVVLFYPTTIPAATSFPGGIDCTPVSCPFGMRAYKFTSSGSITI